MILVDSNIWLALALSKHLFYPAAQAWLAQRTSADIIYFCRSTQQSFLRLLTTQAILAPYGLPPLTNKEAWSTYEAFFADKRIAWADESSDLDVYWKKWAAAPKASPKLWMDAYLAAFATAGGYQFVTTDQAFQQFKGLNLLVLSSL